MSKVISKNENISNKTIISLGDKADKDKVVNSKSTRHEYKLQNADNRNYLSQTAKTNKNLFKISTIQPIELKKSDSKHKINTSSRQLNSINHSNYNNYISNNTISPFNLRLTNILN